MRVACSRTHWLSVWAAVGNPTSTNAISILIVSVTTPCLELQGYGQDRDSIRRSGYDGHQSMSTRDTMNPFPPTPLIKSHRSQNGCQDHPWGVNPGQRLVQTDGPARCGPRNLGRADREVCAREVQGGRYRAERSVHRAAGRAGAPATCEGPRNDRGDQREGSNQPEPLVDHQHVRPLIEPRLILGTALGLGRREAKVLQRKPR